jgi:hypothetical protein
MGRIVKMAKRRERSRNRMIDKKPGYSRNGTSHKENRRVKVCFAVKVLLIRLIL